MTWSTLVFLLICTGGLSSAARGVRRVGRLSAAAVGRPACPNRACRAVNPAHARYCRRCGRAVDVARSWPTFNAARPRRQRWAAFSGTTNPWA